MNTCTNVISRPLEGTPRISSGFAAQECTPRFCRRSSHNGADYAVPVGTPLYAPATGTIAYILDDKLNGNGIGLRWSGPDGANYVATMIHLSQVMVEDEQPVCAGELIGMTGNTGSSEGPHLHITIRREGEEINPEEFFENAEALEPTTAAGLVASLLAVGAAVLL